MSPPAMRIMPGMTVQAEALLSVSQVAALFGVDPKTVTRWCKNGRFDDITVIRTPGGHRKFVESDIMALKAKLTERQTPAAARCPNCTYLVTAPAHKAICG